MDLEPQVVWLIGVVTVVLVFLAKLAYNKTGKYPPTWALQWFAFGISCVMAYIFGAPVFPPLVLAGDPAEIVMELLAWVSDFLVAVGPFFTYATLIYTTLWKGVVEKLPDLARKVFRLS